MGALGAGRSSKRSGQHDGRVHRLRPRTSRSSQLGKPRHRHQSAPQHGNLSDRDEARHGEFVAGSDPVNQRLIR